MSEQYLVDEVAPPEEHEFSIRYEGGDAIEHELELSQLGISLQGFARVLAVCAHVANTGKYAKQFDALSVRVYAAPVQEHHCYEVVTHIKDIVMSKELWSGFGGVTLTLLVQYVFSRRKEEEMKHLSDALQKAMGQNASMADRLLATIEKMADALRPAAKQALQPIGNSCEAIGIYRAGESVPAVVMDRSTKEAVQGSSEGEILPTKQYVGTISEMDMESGNCRVTLEGDDQGGRVAATITDPLGRHAQNPYVLAMAQIRPLAFMAKAQVDGDGSLVKLYISDVVLPPLPNP